MVFVMFFLFESVTKVSAIWIRTLSDYKPQIGLGYERNQRFLATSDILRFCKCCNCSPLGELYQNFPYSKLILIFIFRLQKYEISFTT